MRRFMKCFIMNKVLVNGKSDNNKNNKTTLVALVDLFPGPKLIRYLSELIHCKYGFSVTKHAIENMANKANKALFDKIRN